MIAARTAPNACGVDVIETMALDGEDKDWLITAMREIYRTATGHFLSATRAMWMPTNVSSSSLLMSSRASLTVPSTASRMRVG